MSHGGGGVYNPDVSLEITQFNGFQWCPHFSGGRETKQLALGHPAHSCANLRSSVLF